MTDGRSLDEIEARLKAAHAVVSDLSHGRRRWTMSSPARPDDDSGLVIDAALRDADVLLGALRASRQPDPSEPPAQGTFQVRVRGWMLACFGMQIAADKTGRNHRFIEEALELVQANGCTREEAQQLVEYVFSRPVGEPHQECGGVLVSLAALCDASGLNFVRAAEDELARVWGRIEEIRAKQVAKPKHGPLPEPAPPASAPATEPPPLTDEEPDAQEKHVRQYLVPSGAESDEFESLAEEFRRLRKHRDGQ